MSRALRHASAFITLLILGSLAGCASTPAAGPRERLENGLYAVAGDGAEMMRGDPELRLLDYDPKLSDPNSEEPARKILVDTRGFVPLVLEAPPESRDDSNGRPMLEVSLRREYVGALESFTREHLGGPAAVVLDGAVISVHKVRNVISSGGLQITRCTDRACEMIRSKLLGSP